MVPVFWYRFSVPVSGACVIGITYAVKLYSVLSAMIYHGVQGYIKVEFWNPSVILIFQ